MKTIDQLRIELHAFCELAQRRGYKIGFAKKSLSDNEVVCPIGALNVVLRGVPNPLLRPYYHADSLFENMMHARAFYAGFDTPENNMGYEGNIYFELGKEFRYHYSLNWFDFFNK